MSGYLLARLRFVALGTFVLIWLLPFFWAGWLGRLPFRTYSRLSFQYTAAGLFTHKTSAWSQMLLQVRGRDSDAWVTLDTQELSPMGAFGYRQRLDRILQEAQGKRGTDPIRERLAAWVAERHRTLHPETGEVAEVRFAQMVWPAGIPEMSAPSGHWIPNPPSLPAEVRPVVIATYHISDGTATLCRHAHGTPLKPSPKSSIPVKAP